MANVVSATFDTNTLDGRKKIFNAQNGASKSMKDLDEGSVINVVDVLIYEDKVDSYGQETTSKITVLFEEDGTAYASISETVARASENLIGFIEQFGGEPVPVKLVKGTSQSGRDFLNLQVM